jgi:hypothetical protein
MERCLTKPLLQQLNTLLAKIQEIGIAEKKLTGFTIGNTTKLCDQNFYFTPIRNTSIMIVGGVIVYTEEQALHIAKYIDGQVDYILVDAEKKLPNSSSLTGEAANIERTVREALEVSKLWIYKGNDLSVEAVDGLLTQLTRKSVRGIGGKKVAILGGGNLGAKLALKLVERGANVFLTRRNQDYLEKIVEAINLIKPVYTQAKLVGVMTNEEAVRGAEVLIVCTPGKPVVDRGMISSLARKAIVIDAGKGTLFEDAILFCEKRKIKIYRLDITAAFEGMIHSFRTAESILDRRYGRRKMYGENLVSGGFLARRDEIVVDNIREPLQVFGIADGRGDFVRKLSDSQKSRIAKLDKTIQSFKERLDKNNLDRKNV